MPDLKFSYLRAADLAQIERQPSQRMALGVAYEYDATEAEALADQAVAWTVRQDGRIVACFGVAETFAGVQGWGWALLAPGIGFAHHRLTAFVRGQVEAAPVARLEVLARAKDIEPVLARSGAPDDPALALQLALLDPSPEVRWARLLGLKPAHALRCYGAASETYVLFEQIRPELALHRREAA